MTHARALAAAGFAVLAVSSASPVLAQTGLVGQQCVPAVANPERYSNCRLMLVEGDQICRCAITPERLSNRNERLEERLRNGTVPGGVLTGRTGAVAPATGAAPATGRNVVSTPPRRGGVSPSVDTSPVTTGTVTTGTVTPGTVTPGTMPVGVVQPGTTMPPVDTVVRGDVPKRGDTAPVGGGKDRADTAKGGKNNNGHGNGAELPADLAYGVPGIQEGGFGDPSNPGQGRGDRPGKSGADRSDAGKNNNGLGNGWDPGDSDGSRSYQAGSSMTDLAKGEDPSNPAHGSGSDGPGKSEGSKGGDMGGGKGGGKK